MNLKKIILIINILLTALIGGAIFLGYQTWRTSQQAQSVLAGADKPSSVMEKKNGSSLIQKGLETFANVIEKDVFRTPKGSGKEPPPDTGIPPINLNDYELKGTIIGTNVESLAVILHRSTREHKFYYLRDRIQGAMIAQIKTDQVILDLGNGQTGNLYMMLAKDSSAGSGFEAFPKSVTPALPNLPPLPKVMAPSSNSEMNPPVIKNLRPKPIEIKKRPLS